MALIIKCSRCHKELNEPGGLFFTPPDEDRIVVKLHLCVDCSHEMVVQIVDYEMVVTK